MNSKMTHFDEGFTFIWKIENFSMLPHQNGERLYSPKFVVECLDKTKWFLLLFPKGHLPEVDKYLSLYLCRDWDSNKTASKLNFTLSLETVNSAFEIPLSYENEVFNFEDGGSGLPKFRKLKAVYDNMNLYAPQDILTIGCHMWPSQDNVPAIQKKSTTISNYFSNRFSARTTIKVQRRVLAWPIKKISTLEKSKEKIFINLANSSEDFPALQMSFYIDKTLNDKHAQIDILQTRSSLDGLFVKCKITVVSADKNLQTTGQDSHFFSSMNLDEVWHFPDFILIENIDKEYVYVDDTMFLDCEFAFSYKGGENHFEIPKYMPIAVVEEEHSQSKEVNKSVQALFKDKKLCDVELHVGDQTIPCHKLFLSAQSPVFTAMFENDMRERETGVVEITDVDPRALEKMLTFLYLEEIEDGLSIEEICNLYSAADKYDVVLLKRRCSLLLLSKLTLESICRVLVTADNHQDHFLFKHVNNFLSIHAREVFRSPQWKNFMIDNPMLSRDIMINIFMQEPYVGIEKPIL